jgi:ligand-binding sensor domain-containing protein
LALQCLIATAQEISFFHLNTANGLSDNLVTSALRDKTGILWIGTAEGLNSYDGYTVKKYYNEDHPELTSNNISGLLLDDSNRIWVRNFSNKITLVDEKRKFISVQVMDNGKEAPARMFCKTRSRGILVFDGNKIFALQKGKQPVFEKLKWSEDTTLISGYVNASQTSSDTILITGNNRLCIFDAATLKVLYSIRVPRIIGAAWLNKEELIVTTQVDRELLRVNLPKKAVVHNYATSLKDQYGKPVNGYLRYMGKLNDGKFITSSPYGGVYIFDEPAGKLYRHMHEPLNTRSISANNTFYVFTDNDGYAYISTRTTGINYFNTNYQLADYRSAFQETEGGRIFHGFISCITRHPRGNFWLGTQTGLMEWNREMNYVRFHDYGMVDGVPLKDVEAVKSVCFDRQGKLWVGLIRYGIVVLDKNRRPVKYFSTRSALQEDRLPGNKVNSFMLAEDNKLWASTSGGLCIINTESLKIERIDEASALKPLEKIMCYSSWFHTPDEVWIGTNLGAYRYRYRTNQLYLFDTAKGLPARIVFSFAGDKTGTVYAAGHKGLYLFSGDSVAKIYLRSNGLVNDRCYGLLTDEAGHIWIGNNNSLLSYNPSDSSFSIYDDSYGLSPSGYREISFYQDKSGEQVWGSDIGLSYFLPGKLKQIKKPLHVAVNSFTAGNKVYNSTENGKIKIPFASNHLTFGFSAIDLYRSKSLIYEYKLDGADVGWIRTQSPQQVAYSKLNPGTYRFRVRISKDGKEWVEAANTPTIIIQTPWWRSYWFIGLCMLGAAAVAYYFIRRRSKRIKEQKDELETEQAINYFATSMTGQGTVENTLWDVAKNCIGRLGFEDCVIYLLDEKRNVLVQKAAWGPKTTEENLPAGQAGKILNPLEIPLGSGIVGAVAQSGNAEIISDTSQDKRYIIDDIRRFSEITVPVISGNKVLGIIDSEHPKKNFFTQHHLSVLTTIASLCANKIVRAKAEEEKNKAEKNLLETERQTAEMEMQALRAQMNPHFMFNSLNSINNFILKNDPDNASEYLTRFSRLMRLILDNSREEWVTLENEIKALELYIEMEAIRFDNVFEHHIRIAPDVNPLSVMVPPMLLQPYVENAIWHGLLHRKEPGSKLNIDIWRSGDELFIKIEDNGVGRAAAEQLKGKFSGHKKSHGMKITAKRLDMVNKVYQLGAKVLVEDLKEAMGKAAGTSVVLQLKYKTGHAD